MQVLFIAIALLLFSCKAQVDEPTDANEEINDSTTVISYLALGDSYTIGEGVSEAGTYPMQLSKALKVYNIDVVETKIIAKTGWTTDELKTDILKRNLSRDWDLVSLLIGVNNQFRGRPQANFRTEFEELLNMSIQFANGDTSRVFVLSIPDYGVTPFGQNNNTNGQISKEIDEFNAIKQEICLEYNVDYYNITEISRLAENDLSLLASDRLHPSAAMYKLWVDKIVEEISIKILSN